ncbi:MAG: UDP-N-acetylglucosamine 2-epimerase (non-hydrolyzing) [Sedimentisphaerales bacterium]|nr:UDP-N-acetylglucosamine 2-epimerase (non-hydrolyzing) [Sedimentisphaerales bacterium]
MKLINIVGARPNFMKIAPLMAEYRKQDWIEPLLVHTGQHYDEKMSALFFRELGIPKPDINLGVGSGTHAAQTADIMKAFEPVCLEHKPDAVLVVGDVNSTIACGLVAAKLGIRLIHVEAGLRSFDRTMPEEINRRLTDALSDLLFCTEQAGVDNLLREGVPQEKIFLVGHVMIDTLLAHVQQARQSTLLDDLQKQGCLNGDGFAVVTLHRPSNVDDPAVFSRILDALEVIQKDLSILFPVHPRTRKTLSLSPLDKRVKALSNLHLMEPIGYLDFLQLTCHAKLVLTDSGGIQEETTALQVPCLTLRENTERPVTVQIGSNQLVGTDTARILAAYTKVIQGTLRKPQIPPLWDGKASGRIVNILLETWKPPTR